MELHFPVLIQKNSCKWYLNRVRRTDFKHFNFAHHFPYKDGTDDTKGEEVDSYTYDNILLKFQTYVNVAFQVDV